MKALITERPERHYLIKIIFRELGIEITFVYRQGEFYAYAYIHYDDSIETIKDIIKNS